MSGQFVKMSAQKKDLKGHMSREKRKIIFTSSTVPVSLLCETFSVLLASEKNMKTQANRVKEINTLCSMFLKETTLRPNRNQGHNRN